MAKTKDRTGEPPVVYDDPLMGRREFKTKWEFTQAAEHEKWCCNCRYCHHAHYWRFDEDDETCQVVMETCQCRKNPPRGGVFRGPGGAEKAPLGGFSLGISALGRAEGVAL